MRKSGKLFSPHFVGCAQIYHQRWHVRPSGTLAEGIVCLLPLPTDNCYEYY